MSKNPLSEALSPWWRNAVILVMIIGFSILITLTVKTYKDAPPIPEKVIAETGETVFTGDDIIAGQQVFLKYGLMENGTIWGHGAYLGPDFSAAYLHTLTQDAAETLSRQQYRRGWTELSTGEQKAIRDGVQHILKENRYNSETRVLRYTPAETSSFKEQVEKWRAYFTRPAENRGLLVKHIKDPDELRQLTAFFAWAS
jgi:nitric oxide reductase subunit B